MFFYTLEGVGLRKTWGDNSWAESWRKSRKEIKVRKPFKTKGIACERLGSRDRLARVWLDTEYGKSKIALNTLALSIEAGFHLNVGGLCDCLTNRSKAVPVFRPRPEETYIFPFLSLGTLLEPSHCSALWGTQRSPKWRGTGTLWSNALGKQPTDNQHYLGTGSRLLFLARDYCNYSVPYGEKLHRRYKRKYERFFFFKGNRIVFNSCILRQLTLT